MRDLGLGPSGGSTTARASQLRVIVGIHGLPGAPEEEIAVALSEQLESPAHSLRSFLAPPPTGAHLAGSAAPHGSSGCLAAAALSAASPARVAVFCGLDHAEQWAVLREASSVAMLVCLAPQGAAGRAIDSRLQALRSAADVEVPAASDSKRDVHAAAAEIRRLVERAVRDALLQWLCRDPAVKLALDLALDHALDVHIVGGAIRDFLMLDSAKVDNLDLVARNGDRRVFDKYDESYPFEVNRHGNRRYQIGAGVVAEIWTPGSFFAGYPSLRSMLEDFDLSINSISIGMGCASMENPAHGLRDINLGQVTLSEGRWLSSSDFEASVLCLRLLRTVNKRRLRLTNPGILRARIDTFHGCDAARIERYVGDRERAFSQLSSLAKTGTLEAQ